MVESASVEIDSKAVVVGMIDRDCSAHATAEGCRFNRLSAYPLAFRLPRDTMRG
jgi:hypothetical protein